MNDSLALNLIRRIAVGDMLRRRALTHTDAEVLVDYREGERRALTFGEMNRRVNQLVYGLRESGLKQHDRVALLGANSEQFLIALMACFKGGFVAVPINYLQSPDIVEYTIRHCGANAIFADATLQPMVRGIIKADDNFVLTELVASNESSEHTDFMPFTERYESQPDTEVEDIEINDDDLAQIMYTSGTTAKPKGVMTSHKNVVLATLSGGLTLGLGYGHSNGLTLLPLFHITAETGFLTNMHLGSKTVLMRGFDAEVVLRLIEKERVNGLVLLPMMWKALLACPSINQHDYSSLRSAIYAMAPMDAPTLAKLESTFGCKFCLGSGQTESTAVSTILYGKWSGIKQGNYWGEAALLTDMAILDDHGQQLGVGEVGEICWRSPQIMLGYYDNQKASAEARAYGWHHSGDLGYVDEDGQVLFVDRKKDIVKTGGENVSSVHVERTILSFPGVENCAVIGLEHPRWGEAVTAIVKQTNPGEIEERELLDWCSEQLAPYEKPKRIIFVDQLPMTATGKVQKHELRLSFAGLYTQHS